MCKYLCSFAAYPKTAHSEAQLLLKLMFFYNLQMYEIILFNHRRQNTKSVTQVLSQGKFYTYFPSDIIVEVTVSYVRAA